MHHPSQALLSQLIEQISTIIIGKRAQIAAAITCLLANGHLLIEDVPGVGKTTLAQAIAASLGLQFARVQFTADLLPSDLTGISIYERAPDQHQGQFIFHPGPVFTQVLLADEINRAGPKAQSALLEAMEEKQVTIEGQTHALPHPFFVIATQNPSDQLGTFPLPESQLDRFMMRISLGYPDARAERQLLAGHDRRAAVPHLRPIMSLAQFDAAQAAARDITVSDALLDYLQAIISATRNGNWFTQGLSPRAALALLAAARATALLQQRPHVSPDDIQKIAGAVIAHRLVPIPQAGCGSLEQTQAMLASIGLR